MKKQNLIFLIVYTIFFNSFSQTTLLVDRSKEGQNSAKPKIEEPKAKQEHKAKKNDHTGKVLSNGFALTANFGGTRGLTSGKYSLNNYVTDYSYSSYTSSKDYEMSNSIGYRGGFGIGFQTRGYGFEFPVTYCVDRFKVPSLSSKEKLKVTSLEVGINNYFKFIKAKHFIVFGPYIAFDFGTFDFDLHSAGLNLGYGFNFTKRLNLSLRYKFNIKSVLKEGNYSEYTAVGIDLDKNSRSSQYNSLQLVLRFDLINTRRWRDPKSKIASYNAPYTPAPTTAPTSTPAKIAIDYSTYTDENLKQALKDAKNLTDMNLIQIEMDKRKASANEFDKYNDTQLKELLNSAVAKEEYERAEVIKNEIKNRETIQKNKPVDPNSLESKSIEELTNLLNAALAKEDYDKAAEIKAVIDKKK